MTLQAHSTSCDTDWPRTLENPDGPNITRVVEGSHRTYITDFIRDARAGGCAVGLPPSNLGFRLVREDEAWTWLRTLLTEIGLSDSRA